MTEIDRPRIPGYYWVSHRALSRDERTTVVRVYRRSRDGETLPDTVFLDGAYYSVDDEVFLKWSGPIEDPRWVSALPGRQSSPDEESPWKPGPADLSQISHMARRARAEIARATGDAGVAVIVAVALVDLPPLVFAQRNVSNTGEGPDAKVLSDKIARAVGEYLEAFPTPEDEWPS